MELVKEKKSNKYIAYFILKKSRRKLINFITQNNKKK